MRHCGYITREGEFIDLNKRYPDSKETYISKYFDKKFNFTENELKKFWTSKHTQFEEEFNLNEDYLLIYHKWVKLTACLDEYIYMGIEPLTNAQQDTLIKLGYKIEEFDI